MVKILLYIFVISTYGIFLFDETIVNRLAKEDGPIENIGAIYFLISSALFCIIYFKDSGSGNRFGKFHIKRNVFYILLGLLLFVCFGEEISWGQRIIGWETPAALEELNRQNETNLHNLDILYVGDFNLLLIFTLFCLSYFVLLPLLNTYSSWANKFFTHIGLPCPPLWLAGLILINNVLVQVVMNADLDMSLSNQLKVYEFKETNYAFVYVVFGVCELRKNIFGSKPLEMQNGSKVL
ncbi:MAG: hypothetical protein NPINA01_14590 [Nitrospinaceae bacterium]|nr:MAG: hypothetical protein NPINA01_14590 [Nitrospinaceae bacterium]